MLVFMLVFSTGVLAKEKRHCATFVGTNESGQTIVKKLETKCDIVGCDQTDWKMGIEDTGIRWHTLKVEAGSTVNFLQRQGPVTSGWKKYEADMNPYRDETPSLWYKERTAIMNYPHLEDVRCTILNGKQNDYEFMHAATVYQADRNAESWTIANDCEKDAKVFTRCKQGHKATNWWKKNARAIHVNDKWKCRLYYDTKLSWIGLGRALGYVDVGSNHDWTFDDDDVIGHLKEVECWKGWFGMGAGRRRQEESEGFSKLARRLEEEGSVSRTDN